MNTDDHASRQLYPADQHEQPGQRRRGTVLVGTAALLWSSGGLIVRSLEATNSWTVVFWRALTACIFLLVFIVVRDGRGAPKSFLRIGWPGLVIALCYAIASTALIIAFHLTSVAKTLVIMSSSPLLAAALAWLVLGERVGLVTWFAMFVSIIGIGVMVSESYVSGSAAGDVVAGLIALAQAVAAVVIRQSRTIQMTPAMCVSMLLTLIAVSPFSSPVTATDLVLLTFFGAGQLGVGLALFSYGAPLIPVAQVALLKMLEPIFGPFWVWLILSEQPSKGALIGGAIVLSALAANLMIAPDRNSIRSKRRIDI